VLVGVSVRPARSGSIARKGLSLAGASAVRDATPDAVFLDADIRSDRLAAEAVDPAPSTRTTTNLTFQRGASLEDDRHGNAGDQQCSSHRNADNRHQKVRLLRCPLWAIDVGPDRVQVCSDGPADPRHYKIPAVGGS
jgi:hypothetical protein